MQRTSVFDNKHAVAGSIAGDGKLQEFLSKVDKHSKDQAKQESMREERKAAERKQKELETKAFLDKQVEAKKERKEYEKIKEHQLAEKVYADVQAFETSKREQKVTHMNKMHQHLDGLMKQIEETKSIPKKAPHVAKIGISLAEHELLINKKLIEDVDGDKAFPGSPNTIKRPF